MSGMPAIDVPTMNRLTEYHYWLIRHAYDRGREDGENGHLGTPDDNDRDLIVDLVVSRTRATLEGR